MKKTFPVHLPGKPDARVLEAIKHDLRKYVRRERNKPIPDGFERWAFKCRVGEAPDTAQPTPLKELSRALDDAAKAGGPTVYVEILAEPAHGTQADDPAP